MSRLKLVFVSVLALGSLMLPSLGNAHEFWIEARDAGTDSSPGLAVHLYVGETFQGEEFPFDPGHLKRFEAHTEKGSDALTGRAGRMPAGYILDMTTEPTMLVYASRGSEIALDPAKFQDYLKEDGLDHMLASFDASTKGPVRERFKRNCKTLVLPEGTGGGELSSKVFGLELEIIPTKKYDTFLRGDEVEVEVLFQGNPLAGASIFATSKSDPEQSQRTTTDNRGRATFQLTHEGLTMFRLVHMEPAKNINGIDYVSFWSTLIIPVS